MATETPLPSKFSLMGHKVKTTARNFHPLPQYMPRSGKQESSCSSSTFIQYFQLRRTSLAMSTSQSKQKLVWETSTSCILPTCHCTRTDEVVWGVTNTELGGSPGTKQEKKYNQSSYSKRVKNRQVLVIRFAFSTAEEHLLSQLLCGGSQVQCGGYEYCTPGRSLSLLHPLLCRWPWQLEQEKSWGHKCGGRSTTPATHKQLDMCLRGN